MAVTYSFCGVNEPHDEHTFYLDNGIHIGGSDYACLGWVLWQ